MEFLIRRDNTIPLIKIIITFLKTHVQDINKLCDEIWCQQIFLPTNRSRSVLELIPFDNFKFVIDEIIGNVDLMKIAVTRSVFGKEPDTTIFHSITQSKNISFEMINYNVTTKMKELNF